MASLRTLFISLLAALALAVAPTASAVIFGTADGDAHPYVVAVGQIMPDGSRGAFCSGTLVSPTVVVTAAHCGLIDEGSSDPAPAGQTFLVFHAPVYNTVAPVPGTFTPHRSFCVGCAGAPAGFGGHDLAVIELSRPLPGPYADLPKPKAVERSFSAPSELVMVGFGLSETGTFGVRRQGTALAYVSPEFSDFLFLPSIPPRYSSACFGDSGGANLVGDTLIAVNSIGDDSCLGPSYSYRLDIPSAFSWLNKYVHGAPSNRPNK